MPYVLFFTAIITKNYGKQILDFIKFNAAFIFFNEDNMGLFNLISKRIVGKSPRTINKKKNLL